MPSLTSRQRDLLRLLLESSEPLGAAELAQQLSLTPRQVNYSLKGLRPWLAGQDILLHVTPGVGVMLDVTADERERLSEVLVSAERIRLVVRAEQRQQMIAHLLLDAGEPMILYQLQRLAGVSRSTILRDLDGIAGWLHSGLSLERRPNYGIEIRGSEWHRREALAMMLWGEGVPEGPITSINYHEGLQFPLGKDARHLPLVEKVQAIVEALDPNRAFGHVAYAEAKLGGRFTDDAVLFLALVLAIQVERVRQDQVIQLAEGRLQVLKTLPVWAVARQIARRMGWREGSWPEAEVASIAMHVLAAPRNERWPGDMEIDNLFVDLIDALMQHIGSAYREPALGQDLVLRDGVAIQVIPACMRQRYQLWMPAPAPETTLSDRFTREHALARDLDDIVAAHMGIHLSGGDLNGLALLLRAAYLREQKGHEQKVLIVCPSGMATAQLLVARLKARFPHLGTYTALSLREISRHHVANADLIITTAPLPARIGNGTHIIQVHPLLLPEDVEAITQWLR